MSADERLAERLAASTIPHRPRAARLADPIARREIACRSCGRFTKLDDGGRWRHEADGTLACVDPATLKPYACAFDPIGCRGRIAATGPGTARCACGWVADAESPDRPAAFAAWVCHTASVPSYREKLADRMADDERHADHGGEGS